METLKQVQVDLLKEVGTIGAGHAASGISALLGRRIDIKTPHVRAVSISEVADCLGGADQIVCGIHLSVIDQLKGSALMILPKNLSSSLIELLTGKKPVNHHEFSDYEVSALNEFGNIAIGAYLSALSELTGFTLLCSIPSVATDMLGALLDEVLIETSQTSDIVVLIDSAFLINEKKYEGYFLLIFEPDSLDKLFEKFKIK